MAQHDLLFGPNGGGSHVVPVLYPVADAFAGGVTGDVIAMRHYGRVTFLVFTGAIEDAGISNLVTIEACDDVTPSNTVAMAFRSRVQLSSTTVDAWGALTARAATGNNFALANPVANAVWMCEVTADEIEAAAAGYGFVRIKIAETANKTITACAIAILSEPRYPQAIPLGAIA